MHHRGRYKVHGDFVCICFVRYLWVSKRVQICQPSAPCKGNFQSFEQALLNLIQPDEKRLFQVPVTRIGFIETTSFFVR
jgi:hypothetical protein